MTAKTPRQRDYYFLMLPMMAAVLFLIVFGGVPIAWLSKHGADYGLGELTRQLRELLYLFRPAA